MKKNRLLFSVAALAIGGIFLTVAFLNFDKNSSYTSRYLSENPIAEKGIHGAIEYYYNLKKNQVTGIIDVKDVLKAEHESGLMYSSRSSALNLVWDEMGPDNVGGRTRALLIDPTNPNRMYAGGVAGGLWVSNNAGGTWNKVSESAENLAVTCITRASNGDIYFGTGEGLSSNGGGTSFTPGIIGRGVFKSTDGGNTFTQLSATKPVNGNSTSEEWALVNDIVAHPTNPLIIYAGTSRGLRVTEDGGNTWVNNYIMTVSTTPAPLIGDVTDIDNHSDGTMIVSLNRKAYISSTGVSGSFINQSTTQTGLPTAGSRAEFTIAPSNSNIMYASLANGGGFLQGIYHTSDKGQNWTLIGPGGSVYFEPFGFFTGQGAYDNAIAVSPFDPEVIMVGGVELWQWKQTQSSPVAGQWTRIAYEFPNIPQNPLYVHSDKHDIKFHPTDSSVAYIATDGGLFKFDGVTPYYPTNKNYNVTQFFSVAFSGLGEILGGTQDNGTLYIDFKGNSSQSAVEVNGGDGAHCEISQLNSNILFATSQFGVLVRSKDKGKNAGGFGSSVIDPVIASGAPFVTPIELWESFDDPNSLDSVKFIASPMSQNLGVSKGGNKAFTDTLSPTQSSAIIIPGSIEVKAGAQVLTDVDNGNGTGTFAGSGSGTINYTSGRISVAFTNAPLTNTIVVATYKVQYTAGTTIKVTSKTAGYPFDYQLPVSLFQGDSILIHDRVQAKLALGLNGSVWITRRALDFAADPSWIRVADIFGTQNMAFTKDGNILYVGTIGGAVYRISNLSALVDSMKTPTSTTPANATVQVAQIYNNVGRFITDVSVDPNNNDHLVITLGNYGNTTYIERSINATAATPTFTPKQGTGATKLPAMPVYTAVIDRTDAKRVIIGTEYGIYSTSDITVSNPVWTAENNGMPRVPVFMMRQQTQDLSWDRQILNSGIIYAGTHGRGFFKTNTLASPGVSVPEKSSIIDKIASVKVYPNPMSTIANLNFTLPDPANNANIKFYDFNGKVVKMMKLQNLRAGNQTVTFNNEEMPVGTYFVRLEAGTVNLNTKLVVIK